MSPEREPTGPEIMEAVKVSINGLTYGKDFTYTVKSDNNAEKSSKSSRLKVKMNYLTSLTNKTLNITFVPKIPA